MKTEAVTCDRCNGTGKFRQSEQCIRCLGKGVLSRDRVLWLLDVWLPKQTMSPTVMQNAEKVLQKMLRELSVIENENIQERVGKAHAAATSRPAAVQLFHQGAKASVEEFGVVLAGDNPHLRTLLDSGLEVWVRKKQ